MHSNPHNGDPCSHTTRAIDFLEATDDTAELVAAATRAAARAWREGFRYVKAGIVLTELIPMELVQHSFLTELDREKRVQLMGALDAVNKRYGRGTLYPAAAGIPDSRSWSTKFEKKSPRYTTQWAELPVVRT